MMTTTPKPPKPADKATLLRMLQLILEAAADSYHDYDSLVSSILFFADLALDPARRERERPECEARRAAHEEGAEDLNTYVGWLRAKQAKRIAEIRAAKHLADARDAAWCAEWRAKQEQRAAALPERPL